MSHPPEFEREARKLYSRGMLPSRIAKRLKIPPSTIYDWTRDVKPARLFIFNCGWCEKKGVREHLSRKYCSDKCKQKAKYQRSQKTRRTSRQCVECGESFPARSNKRFCSKRCKDRKAKRSERERNNQNVVQSRASTPDDRSNRTELINYSNG